MIRPYKTEDKKRLLEIFKLNIPQYFAAGEFNDFKEYLQIHPATYLTIEHENKIVGGAGYYIKESDYSGRITWIFFHPNYSGLGLGRKIMEHCLKILRSDSSVQKLVVTTSQLAYAFFEKFGYELIQIKKDYWGDGFDLYLMEQEVK